MSLPNANDIAEAIRLGKLGREIHLQQYLASHPAERLSLEEELALSRLLAEIPDQPVPSNFTARVLEAIQADQRSRTRAHAEFWRRFGIRGWIPQAATLGAVVGVAWLSYAQYQAAGRQELARNLAEISRSADGTSLEVLQNFEAIDRLNNVPRNEARELIAALQ